MAPPFGPFWHVGIFPGTREMTGGCGLERHREPVFHEFFEMDDEDVFISALVLGPRCPNATLRVGISRASRLLMRAVRRSDLFRSKKMNVLRDSRSSRFALRLQFCCAQYSTSPSMLLARQVNVQQCVSFLFVSPTSFLSPLKRFLLFNCVKRVRHIFLLHRGWKLEGKCLS